MALTLVMHELTTNAIKYGALSTRAGIINVAWKVTDDNDLKLRWMETGGPPVAAPTRKGFGSRLLEATVAAEHGTLRIKFLKTGLKCDLVLPLPPHGHPPVFDTAPR